MLTHYLAAQRLPSIEIENERKSQFNGQCASTELSRKFWSGGPILSWKIGPPLKIWSCNGPFFSGNIGPGIIYFRKIGPGD